MKVIQFVYLRSFPEIYSLIDKRGINLKSEFLLTFKAWKDKKKLLNSGSITINVEKRNAENVKNSEKELNDEKVSEKLNEKKLKGKVLAENLS